MLISRQAKLFRTLLTTENKRRLSSASAVPRRALLYVPGSSTKMIDKAMKLKADCVCLDCEDGVSITAKDIARVQIADTLCDDTKFEAGELAVRINSVQSGLADEDLQTLFNLEDQHPECVVVPKIDNVDNVKWLFDRVRRLTVRRPWNLITQIESAESLINIRDVFQYIRSNVQSVRGSYAAAIFGSDDFCASVGITRSAEGSELMYARQKIVTYCKYFNIQPIDMVHIDYKDLEGLRKFSVHGANMGFTGKQVIHPSQINVVQESFSPSAEKIKWAHELLQEYEQHTDNNKGAFVYNDQMIDMPSVLQAQNIKTLSDRINNTNKS